MNEDNNYNELIEQFNVENDNCDRLIVNKPPPELNNKYYKLIFEDHLIKENPKFKTAKKLAYYDAPYIYIIICFFFFLAFYFCLLGVILERDKLLLIFLIIIYIIGSVLQIFIVPDPMKFHSKYEFQTDLIRLLKTKAIITISTPNKKKKTIFPGNYTTDITGTINIPKNIRFIKFGLMQCYIGEDFKEFKTKFYQLKGFPRYSKSLEYNNDKISNYTLRYDLNSENGYSIINKYHRLFCLLLVEWIYAIYKRSKPEKIIEISLVKLITRYRAFSSTTKITFHGTPISADDCIYSEISKEFYENLENEYKEKQDKKKMEKMEAARKEKERRDNMLDLDEFDNNLYNISIYARKDNDKVFANIFIPRRERNDIKINKCIGYYDPNVEGETNYEGNITTYIPRGCDVKIIVILKEFDFVIRLGTEHTFTFPLKG